MQFIFHLDRTSQNVKHITLNKALKYMLKPVWFEAAGPTRRFSFQLMIDLNFGPAFILKANRKPHSVQLDPGPSSASPQHPLPQPIGTGPKTEPRTSRPGPWTTFPSSSTSASLCGSSPTRDPCSSRWTEPGSVRPGPSNCSQAPNTRSRWCLSLETSRSRKDKFNWYRFLVFFNTRSICSRRPHGARAKPVIGIMGLDVCGWNPPL